MKRLQNKIFFFFVGLLLVVQSIILISNYRSSVQEKQQQVETQLNSAKTIFKNRFDNRSYYLAAFAETAAKDFGLKQVFEEDTRSFLVALNNHRQRINADMAIAVNAKGLVVGQLTSTLVDDNKYKVSVGVEQGETFRFMQWFELLEDSYLYSSDETIYQLSFSPLKSGDFIFGWVGFGYSIDKNLASGFANLTGLNTGFALKSSQTTWQLLASSSPDASPDASFDTQTLVNQIMNGRQPREVISTIYTLGAVQDSQMIAIMYGLRSDLLATIQERWQALFLLAAITLMLSLAGAFWISASISRPVQILLEQARYITSGNYNQSINFSSADELGQLAGEFEQMKKAVISREQTILYQAFHDSLTGLPNRDQLLARLDQLVVSESQPFALIRLSLQRIQDVNFSLGYEIGDELVKAVARRLATICEADLLFNLGGSAFTIILKNAIGQNLEIFLDAIDTVMEPAIELENMSLQTQFNAGIALFPDHARLAAQLLQMSGTAFQNAQQAGQSKLTYDPGMSRHTVERLQLISDLKNAIRDHQLVLYYQPKMAIDDRIITEVESLVRWQHPLHGLIPPDKFISLAEQTGHIHALTNWVIETALAQYTQWQNEGIELPIAVNVSAQSLKNPCFFQQVMEALKRHKLSPRALCLEVTESVVVDDPEAAIELLKRFNRQGFRLSIDDYGTGYSSLAQLKQLPVHEIKIDKSFILNLHRQLDDQVIVKSTIELAHAMSMGVVAEGIEDKHALQWLARHGCEMAQGYHICRPKPAAELTAWLHRSPYFKSTIFPMAADL